MRAVFNATVKPVYVFARRRLTYVLFERPSGIQTSEVVRLDKLGLEAEDRNHYAPAGWLSLRLILPRSEVSNHDVFADFGSGMGRVVFQAAVNYPFGRVIGIELSRELHTVAEQNVSRSRQRFRSAEVELVNADVLEYEIPDDLTIAYFNNPFTGQVFDAVIQKLTASLERNPRALRIIYANPIEEALLLERGARTIRKVPGMRPTRDWSRSNAIRMYLLAPVLRRRGAVREPKPAYHETFST